MAIKCPKCGSTNPDNARFCWNDGQRLATTAQTSIMKFRSGGEAFTLQELASLMKNNFDEAQEYLYRGYVEQSLGRAGETKFADAARTIVKQFNRDRNFGVNGFLQVLNGKVEFPNGAAANPAQIAQLMDKDWEDGKKYLYSGFLAIWLDYAGESKLASEAQNIASSYKNEPDVGLEIFIQQLNPSIGSPTLTVSPKRIDLGTINNEDEKTVQIYIKNTGRGYLYGDIRLNQNLPGLQISQDEIHEQANITLTLEPWHLTVKRTHQTELVIDTNGGQVRVPFSCYVGYPVSKTILRLAAKGAIGAAIAGAIRGFLYFFEHTSWLSRELSEYGFMGWKDLWDNAERGYEFVILSALIVGGIVVYVKWIRKS